MMKDNLVFVAPNASAPSRIDGGTARREDRQATIIVGKVMNDKTIPQQEQ